ncbi:hypothetical protein P879_09620 [Paragonimus westermani]|uniref:Uncharacterized protein n=1 Tax=Paragonimus westermani TaxID=34504 RepID=A0A8T0D2U5_9TREM|nr:hypothetical protein P879_09620 [Paragonimus westermani]
MHLGYPLPQCYHVIRSQTTLSLPRLLKLPLSLNDRAYTNRQRSFKQKTIGAICLFIYQHQVLLLFLKFSPLTCLFIHKTTNMTRMVVMICAVWLLVSLTADVDCRILREPHLPNGKSFHVANDWEDRYTELPIKKRFHVANVWDEPDEY